MYQFVANTAWMDFVRRRRKRIFSTVMVGLIAASACNRKDEPAAPQPTVDSSLSSDKRGHHNTMEPQAQVHSAVDVPTSSSAERRTPPAKVNEPPVILSNGTQVVKWFEEQQVFPGCHAKRFWIEFENLPNPATALSINTRIRREITVGKTLKREDCIEPEGEEYLFFNEVSLSGAWGSHVGTRTVVCFPGGTGRCVLSCAVYNLKTGKRHNLKKFLKKQTATELEKRINEGAIHDDFPEGYLPLAIEEATYCLQDEGIEAVNINDSGKATTSITIPAAEVSRFFELPSSLVEAIPAETGDGI